MSAGKNSEFYQAFRCTETNSSQDSFELIGEEPLLIRIDDKPYSVVMRTPGEELFHGAGLCLGEGLVDTLDDFKTIGYDKNSDTNVIDIWLTFKRRKTIPELLKRRSYVSQTSCGICGKQMVRDLNQVLVPARDGFRVGFNNIFECVKKLSENQNFYPRTRGSHAALLFGDNLDIISFAEDVGRHNALDKAIGKAFMEKKLSRAKLLVLSSRISYELVQKAARARLSMIISKSRPTALAVEMGKALNMTLGCVFEKSELIIFCGEERLKKQ